MGWAELTKDAKLRTRKLVRKIFVAQTNVIIFKKTHKFRSSEDILYYTYPGLLVDAPYEGWVPLRGPLHPVHAEALSQQETGRGEQDALGGGLNDSLMTACMTAVTAYLLAPGPHLALRPRAHGQPRGGRVPFLKIMHLVKTRFNSPLRFWMWAKSSIIEVHRVQDRDRPLFP